jgi:hypothetical protein
MARDFSEVLQQAMEFYVAGQLVEARALLLDIVRADPKLEAGWMFLSYTLDDPAQKADCLRKVISLNPENIEAQAALEKTLGINQSGPVGQTATAPPAVVPSRAPTEPPPAVQGAGAAAAPVPIPSPSDAPTVVHASPFTVDINHANDEIYTIPEAGSAGGVGRQPTPSSRPPLEPASQPPSSPGITPIQSQAARVNPEPSAFIPPPSAGPAVTAPADGSQPPFPVRKTAPLAQAAPPPRKTGQLQQAAGRSPAPPDGKTQTVQGATESKKRRNTGCIWLGGGAILVMVLVAAGVGLWLTGNLPALLTNGGNSAPSATPAIQDTPTPFQLPPRLTDTPTPTSTLTPTVSPTPSQTLTPTLAKPDATIEADMARIIKEVEDIRGLELGGDVPIYVVDHDQANDILQVEYDRIEYSETIVKEAQALVALGFIKPTYDLARYALTRLSDGVLGFYMPDNRTIYIIGNRFAGMERWTFSHEFDHALVHNHFSGAGIMGDDPVCVTDSQRCEAIRALVEGDAMLVMALWRDQYASAYDERDISLYPYPFLLPPEQNTPPYVSPLVEFSYYVGYAFVYSLWSTGNWAEVNKVYENLPVSTEQILHPKKYLDGEKPTVMRIPNLESTLGPEWTLAKSDSLGEYMSYLLLAYGADNASQISTDTAETATAGWGGDHYLVFASADGARRILAAEWNWDTEADAAQFYTAMQEHVDKRFRGETAVSSSGLCWAMNQETTCIYRSGRNVLWLIGPDLELINTIRSAYNT